MSGNDRSGRRRKAAAQRRLQGSRVRPHHRARPEPTYAVDVPAAPASLSAVARTEWDRITGELNATRVVARVDLAILAVYCTTFGRLEDIRLALGTRMKVGSKAWHRLERSERQTTIVLRSLLGELGITPASRARVSPLPPIAEAPTPDSIRAIAPNDDFDRLEQRLTQRKVVPISSARRRHQPPEPA